MYDAFLCSSLVRNSLFNHTGLLVFLPNILFVGMHVSWVIPIRWSLNIKQIFLTSLLSRDLSLNHYWVESLLVFERPVNISLHMRWKRKGLCLYFTRELQSWPTRNKKHVQTVMFIYVWVLLMFICVHLRMLLSVLFVCPAICSFFVCVCASL